MQNIAETALASGSLTIPIDANKRITAGTVRHLCGGISDMTLWRWLDDASLAFPKPLYIAKRRYWREADVVAWLEARERKAA